MNRLLIGALTLAGCTHVEDMTFLPPFEKRYPQTATVVERIEEPGRRAERLANGWEVGCETIRGRDAPRCYAAAPYEKGGTAPFQIYYFGQQGPFIMAGMHSSRGRYPSIIIDNDVFPSPILDDGGITPVQPQPSLIPRLSDADTARVRYHSESAGEREFTIQLEGFPLAHAKLGQLANDFE